MQTYSVSEIAAALGTDQVTVRRWIAKGDLPGTLDTRKGGYRVAEADLEAFLESRPKYARLAANSGLLGRKASMMVGKAAINRVLKIVGDLPAATAVPYLNAEIEKPFRSRKLRSRNLQPLKRTSLHSKPCGTCSHTKSTYRVPRRAQNESY